MRLKLIFVAFACAIAAGCGGDGPTDPGSQPFNQTTTGTVSSFGLTQHSLNIPRSGNMTVTLTWSTSADLDLYLTSSTCQDVSEGFCQRLAVSDRSDGNTETITRGVTQGEAFKLWVDNFSFNPQNYTVTINIP